MSAEQLFLDALDVATWAHATTGQRLLAHLPSQPGEAADKYSGGVTGIAAGSDAYRGAGLLCTAAAVATTSSMVRVVTADPRFIVGQIPEVVAHDSVDNAGRVQSWVVGPGRGTGRAQVEELSTILDSAVPVILDADALTLLAQSSHVREILRHRRTRGGVTIMTPHLGEYNRLAAAYGLGTLDPAASGADRTQAVLALAAATGACVVLKGRRTVVASSGEEGASGFVEKAQVVVVEAGSSWLATPGSGDVLAGIAGAIVASAQATKELGCSQRVVFPVAMAVVVHCVAGYLAAMTPYGPAPTSASVIGRSVRPAVAWVASHTDT